MTITVSRTITMGHRLMRYKGLCASPHGHNITVDVVVAADEHTFLDFKDVDRILAGELTYFDHTMVLNHEDKLVEVMRSFHQLYYGSPLRVLTLNTDPTTEALAQYFFMRMSGPFEVIAVTVHETAKYSATCTVYTDAVQRVSVSEGM